MAEISIEKLKELLSEQTADVSKLLSEQTVNVSKLLSEQTVNVSKLLSEQTVNASKLLSEQAASVNKRFDEQAASMDKRFDEQAASVNKRFDEQAASMDKRFDDVDNRIGAIERVMATKMATKDDLVDLKDEMMRHMGILIEDVEHKLDLIVEGRVGTHQVIDRNKEECDREHGRLERMALINTADISSLDKRVGRLER